MSRFNTTQIILVLSYACLTLAIEICAPPPQSSNRIECFQCNSPSECSKLGTVVKCDASKVEWTLEELKKAFLDPTIVIKPSPQFMCYAYASTRLDGKEFEVRGCMYRLKPKTNNVIVRYKFDYSKFLIYRKRTRIETFHRYTGSTAMQVYLNFEENNRTYWNMSHYTHEICYQCADEFCNKDISPYDGRKMFQRKFRDNIRWTCGQLENVYEKEFRKLCKDRRIHGYCRKHWKWPRDVYNGYPNYSDYRGGTTARP